MTCADVQIVAHRGASAKAPENTIAAFELAWEMGADAIEADCRLTSDGEVVCIHDVTTERVASELLDVEQAVAADLLAIRLRNKYDPKYDGANIPTLAEVLNTVPEGKKIYIELKSDKRIVPSVLRIFELSELALEQVFMIAFDPEVLRAVKAVSVQYQTGLLVDFKCSGLQLSPSYDEVLRIAREIECDGISVKAHPLLSRHFGLQVKDAGYGFHVWTVDSVFWAKEMVRRGAGSITTNRPDRMRMHLLSKK